MEQKIMAILGRGIQRPSEESQTWELTDDLELCDEKGAHFAVKAADDDSNPLSLIGGGSMNLEAGIVLKDQLKPSIIVCAFGMRSKYLIQIGAPSESQVMSDKLIAAIEKSGNVEEKPDVRIFDETSYKKDATGTNQEALNILELAHRHGIKNVALATVAVHLPRTLLMAKQHITENPDFKDIVIEGYASEMVLLKSDAGRYRNRVERVFGSQSYIRTLAKELSGINDLLAGKYKNIASTIH